MPVTAAAASTKVSRPVLVVSGDITAETAPGLKAALFELIDAGHSEVLLDLEHVSVIGGAGIAVLVAAAKALGHGDGHLAVALPQPGVVRQLALCGLTHLIEVHSSAPLRDLISG